MPESHDWTSSTPKFPPSLTESRARVASTQLLLATGYFNMAWVTHAVTVRLAQMVDLHKVQKQGSDEDYHARSTLFMGLFMLDQYLVSCLGVL